MVRDLLNPSAGYLEMREDAKGGVQVANLSEVSTTSTEEVIGDILLAGRDGPSGGGRQEYWGLRQT